MIQISMPGALYNELWALEVDTYDPDEGSSGRGEFVKAMRDAKKSGRSYKLTLDRSAAEYMLTPNGALFQHQDIWEDVEERAVYRRWVKQAERIADKLREALKRASNPSPAHGLVQKLRF